MSIKENGDIRIDQSIPKNTKKLYIPVKYILTIIVCVSYIPKNLITTWPYSLFHIFFHFSALPIIILNYCTQIHVCFFRTWRVNKSRLAYETSSNLLWFNSMRIQKSLGTMPVLAQLILLHFGPSKALVGVVQPQLFPKVQFETCHFTKKIW